MEQTWGGSETLIVISSDLSHYLPYRWRGEDQDTAQTISNWASGSAHQACGAVPILGLLQAAAHHRFEPHLLDIRAIPAIRG